VIEVNLRWWKRALEIKDPLFVIGWSNGRCTRMYVRTCAYSRVNSKVGCVRCARAWGERV